MQIFHSQQSRVKFGCRIAFYVVISDEYSWMLLPGSLTEITEHTKVGKNYLCTIQGENLGKIPRFSARSTWRWPLAIIRILHSYRYQVRSCFSTYWVMGRSQRCVLCGLCERWESQVEDRG
jgi:hypothetical protein